MRRTTLAFLGLMFFNTGALAQAVNCGEQPKEFPPDVQEKIKGDVEGKAQLFTKLLGDAQLKGQVEASKTELHQKYKDVDKAQLDRYMAWVSCQNIMQDKDLTTEKKNQLWLDLYRQIMGQNKDKQSDETNSIEVQSGVIAVRYPKIRNAQFEATYWASLADKVRVVKSGDTKVSATLDCGRAGGPFGMDISSHSTPIVAIACLNELRLANISTEQFFKFAIGPEKSGPDLEMLEFGLDRIVSKHPSDPCLLVWGHIDPNNLQNTKLLYRMECSSRVRSIALDEKFDLLAVGLEDGTIEIWSLNDVSAKKLFSQKFTHNFGQSFQHDSIEDLEFSDADYGGPGFKLCAHDWGNFAYVIDVPNFAQISVKEIEYPLADQVILSSRLSPNGKLVALGTSDGAVTVWNIATQKNIAKYLHDDQVRAVDFGSNNDIVVSTGLDKTVKSFRISANAVVDTLNLKQGSIALRVDYGRTHFVVGQGTRVNLPGPYYVGEWRLNPGGKISPIADQ